MRNTNDPKILREIYAGFIRIHILYHTAKRPFYGQELKEELEEHGYRLSYGTLYPMLANLESEGYLERKDINTAGKIRKYYSITDSGIILYEKVKEKLKELNNEIFD